MKDSFKQDVLEKCERAGGTPLDLSQESSNNMIVCNADAGRISMHDRKGSVQAEMYDSGDMRMKSTLEEVEDVKVSNVAKNLKVSNEKAEIQLDTSEK